MLRHIEEEKPTTYDHMENIIMKNLNTIIGKKTYRTQGSKRETPEIKKKREEKKQRKKEFQKACTSRTDNIETMKEKYIQAQMELRSEISQWEKQKTKETMKRLITEGGTKSQMFWKLRKKLTNPSQEIQNDTIDEN